MQAMVWLRMVHFRAIQFDAWIINSRQPHIPMHQILGKIVLPASKCDIPLLNLAKFINFVLESVTSMFMWRNFSAQTEPISAEMYRMAGGQNRVF